MSGVSNPYSLIQNIIVGVHSLSCYYALTIEGVRSSTLVAYKLCTRCAFKKRIIGVIPLSRASVVGAITDSITLLQHNYRDVQYYSILIDMYSTPVACMLHSNSLLELQKVENISFWRGCEVPKSNQLCK